MIPLGEATTPRSPISFKKSVPIQITKSGNAYYPNIFTDPSNAKSHVIWGQVNSSGVWVVTYANNVGGNFSTPFAIGGSFDFREQSRIFGQGNPLHLYVVFQAYATKGGLSDVFFTESVDGGANWSAAKALTPAHAKDNKHRYTPAMVVLPNGDVYVVYNKGNSVITWRKRVNGSPNWSTEASITMGVGSAPRFPNIAYTINGSTTFLHVINSAGGGNDNLHYARSGDDGSSWSSAKIISDRPNTSKRNTFVSDLAGNCTSCTQIVIQADRSSLSSR